MSDRPARTEPASAPGRLEVVQDFLNTLHVERGTDALADAAGAGDWLAGSGLGVTADRLTGGDLERVVRFRGVLRALCGDQVPAAAGTAVADFADVLGTTALAPRLSETGQLTLAPVGSDVEAVIGALVTIVLQAQRDGTWDRLKICRNERCRWAFYDLARSRTAVWCAMGICGNRTKVAAHRRRRQASQRPRDHG